MNLWHLEVFREVMRSSSVTMAARNLGRTQPAISASISGLEQDIGYALFERKNGRLHPVPEAHYLMAEAEEILARVGAVERSMKDTAGLSPNQLRIASMPIVAEFLMPRLISQFIKEHPMTRFQVSSANSFRVYEQISAQQFDVGLAEISVGCDLVHVDSIEVDCICALPANSHLVDRPYLTPKDLDGLPFGTFLKTHAIAKALTSAFAEADAHFNVQFEMQNAASQYSLVSSGVAYSLFSPLSAWIFKQTHINPDSIVFLPFQPIIPYPLGILTPAHKSLSRLAQTFVAELKNEIDGVLIDIVADWSIKSTPQQF